MTPDPPGAGWSLLAASGGTGYFDHPLSGFLRCGARGSPLCIVSRSKKDGRTYSQYGCSARNQKGAAVCANGLTIGEARLTDAVVGALRGYFASPRYEEWLRDAYAANERARARAAKRDDEVARLEAAVRTAEKRVENVMESMARLGSNDLLEAKFRAEEGKMLDARRALADAAVPATPALPPPAFSPRAMLSVIENIATAATVKPQKAKELLRGVLDSILMTPAPDGYAVRISLKSISPVTLVGDGADVYETGCGGRI